MKAWRGRQNLVWGLPSHMATSKRPRCRNVLIITWDPIDIVKRHPIRQHQLSHLFWLHNTSRNSNHKRIICHWPNIAAIGTSIWINLPNRLLTLITRPNMHHQVGTCLKDRCPLLNHVVPPYMISFISSPTSTKDLLNRRNEGRRIRRYHSTEGQQ